MTRHDRPEWSPQKATFELQCQPTSRARGVIHDWRQIHTRSHHISQHHSTHNSEEAGSHCFLLAARMCVPIKGTKTEEAGSHSLRGFALVASGRQAHICRLLPHTDVCPIKCQIALQVIANALSIYTTKIRLPNQ